MSSAPLRRIFIGLPLPKKSQQQIMQWRGQCDITKLGKLVPPANFHLTLFFLGGITEQQLADVYQACARLNGQQFNLLFDRVSFWPKPKITALLPTQTPSSLQTLFQRVKQQLQLLGFNYQHSQFRPHITLARKSQADINDQPPSIEVAFNQWAIYQSINRGQGVEYLPLYQWQLTSVGDSSNVNCI